MGHFPQFFVCLPKGIPIQEMTLPETIRLNVEQGKHPCCCTNKNCEILRCQQNLRYMVHCVQCYFGTSNPFPIGSMVLLYMVTFTINIFPLCQHIYQHHGSYGFFDGKLCESIWEYISCTIFFRSPCFQVQPPPRKVGKQHALVRFNWHTNIPRFEWFAIWIAILEYTSFLEPLLQLFQWQYYCLYTIIFNTLW